MFFFLLCEDMGSHKDAIFNLMCEVCIVAAGDFVNMRFVMQKEP